MTASSPSDEEPLTITAAWPQTANAGARVSNIQVYQWDLNHTGIYLMMGHMGLPIWLAPGDRERWEEDHPDHRVAVETLGAFYIPEQVAKDLCRGLATHLGLTITEGTSGAAS